MQQIADGLKTLWVKFLLYFPVPGILPPRAFAEPAGIDPVVIHGQIVGNNLADIFQMVGGRSFAPVGDRDGEVNGFAGGSGPMVRQNELTQQIVAAANLALPEQSENSRRANFLAR